MPAQIRGGFPDRPDLVEEAELGVLVGFLVSAVPGYPILRFAPVFPRSQRKDGSETRSPFAGMPLADRPSTELASTSQRSLQLRSQVGGLEEHWSKMPSPPELAAYIASSFRSVWALELLLHLKRNQEHAWETTDIVHAMRASELVVSNGLTSLIAAGLVVQEGEGQSRYAPASPDIEHLADATEALYAKKPDAVRRIIVSSAQAGITAFADAFRLRKE